MQNIMKMEFIGLNCEVVSSGNKYHLGIKGKITDETLKNFVIKTKNGIKTIPKKNTIFRITVKEKKYDIDGNYLIFRPEDRIKKDFKRW